MVKIGSSTKLFAGVGLAVPRLGNVRLRLHFLRRGTSRGQVNSSSLINLNSVSNRKAYTSANSPQPTDPNYELVCDGSEVANEVYFPSTLIRKNDGVSLLPIQDFAISSGANQVNITSNSSKTIYEIQISDLLGRVVGRYSNINFSSFTFPAATLQKGVYIVSLIDSEGKLFTTKLQR